ncbi:DegT/DnrJ/EryC1/StrS family aminotransferase [Candidatus Poribacteria bacterium]|nr:DegT/DnrJ/EryC1/StrS family aminotransferase [Candidatus Poribacteria bacterium]
MNRIPVNEPDLTGNEQAYVLDAVKSGWISGGQYVKNFERMFAEFVGTKYAITTTSGTAALHLAVASLGIGPGDEVIVPALTIIATVNAVCYTGATPVLVDSEPDTYNIDPNLIEAKITPKTRAILPVHLYGHPADMDPILELARRYHLRTVEDAAEAHGAKYRGRMCGGLGNVNCFSFYGNKIITTGEGGMVTTDDDVLAERVSRLKDLSHSKERRFMHTDVAYTLRMTNIQAALGVAQMERANQFIGKKRWMADTYKQALDGIPGILLPIEKPWAFNVYWMYAILVTSEFGCSRDELMTRLNDRGIDTRSFFFPMHIQPVFKKMGLFREEYYPVAERLSEQGMYLPSGLTITEEQINQVADAIRSIHREVSG